MGDMGDDFNAYRKERSEKRASNRDQSAAILTRAGVLFESKNLGAHLIVTAGAKTVDYWPGTGLWIVRGWADRYRGVRSLVKYVGKQRATTADNGGGNGDH